MNMDDIRWKIKGEKRKIFMQSCWEPRLHPLEVSALFCFVPCCFQAHCHDLVRSIRDAHGICKSPILSCLENDSTPHMHHQPHTHIIITLIWERWGKQILYYFWSVVVLPSTPDQIYESICLPHLPKISAACSTTGNRS